MSIFFQDRGIEFQLSFEVPFTFNASTLTRALSITYKSKQIKLFSTVQILLVSDTRQTDGRTQRHLRFSSTSSASNESVELFCHCGVYSVSLSIRKHVASNKFDCSLLLSFRFSNMPYRDRVEGLKQCRNAVMKKKQIVAFAVLKCNKTVSPDARNYRTRHIFSSARPLDNVTSNGSKPVINL